MGSKKEPINGNYLPFPCVTQSFARLFNIPEPITN